MAEYVETSKSRANGDVSDPGSPFVVVYKCTVSVLTAKATTFCNDALFLLTFQLNVCIKEIVLGDLRPLFVYHTITRA